VRAAHFPRHGAREAHVAPQAADVGGIDDVRLDQLEPRLGPLAGIERDRDVALEQRLERTLDETLGAAERVYRCRNDREPHHNRP